MSELDNAIKRLKENTDSKELPYIIVDILKNNLDKETLNLLIEKLDVNNDSSYSKALKCLEKLGSEKLARGELIRNDNKVEPYLNTIKQALLKSQVQERVLEILFKKQVDLGWLWYCIHECINSLNEYNKKMPIEKFKLTQEEFDTLKEW